MGAGQGVAATHIHGAGPADPFPTGPAEGQGRIHSVLDMDQDVQNHRAAGVDIDVIGVPTGIFRGLGIIAIDLEGLDLGRPSGRRVVAALLDAGILRQGELNHQTISLEIR